MSEVRVSEFCIEEFRQAYGQYRWLDETRGRLVDRFYIVLLGWLAARAQLHDVLDQQPAFLLMGWVIVLIATWTVARSIVRFRRQQDGHLHLIQMGRLLAFRGTDGDAELKEHSDAYKTWLRGRLLTTAPVEFGVAVLATLLPIIAGYDLVSNTSVSSPFSIVWVAPSMLLITIASVIWILAPWGENCL